MSLSEDIKNKVSEYINSKYEITDGIVTPDKKSISFGAQAKKIWSVVLYIDIRDSRKLMESENLLIAARVHKSFLFAASKCVREHDGDLRSFNGDSVLSFFVGEDSAKRAVKAAMKTKCSVHEIINPILKKRINKEIDYGIGVAQGKILVVKSGVPGDEIYQDLIWVGLPTIHAFEYGNMARKPYNVWISKNVYKAIKDDKSMIYSKGKDMWVYNDSHEFSFGNFRVYKTDYYWNL